MLIGNNIARKIATAGLCTVMAAGVFGLVGCGGNEGAAQTGSEGSTAIAKTIAQGASELVHDTAASMSEQAQAQKVQGSVSNLAGEYEAQDAADVAAAE